MACNCGRAARSVIVYQLLLPGGVRREFPTRSEADAANVRAGGRGSVTALRR